MTNLMKLSKLLELRNSLVREEERIEWYDMMDAIDTEDRAIEEMVQEIYRLLDELKGKAPSVAARCRKNLERIINE